jgi:hypothetical protein
MEITGYNAVEKVSQRNRASERREAKERDDAKRANDNMEKVTISKEAREKAVQDKENA